MRGLQRGLAAIGFVFFAAACGSTGPSLADYAADAEQLVNEMNNALDAVELEWSTGIQTVEGAKAYFNARVAIRDEFVARFEILEPPDSVADLHAAALDMTGRLADAERAMAGRAAAAETAEDLYALGDSEEFRAFAVLDEEAIRFCRAAQAQMDATEVGVGFEGMPWIPPEMTEVVEVAFGCSAEERGLVAPGG